MYDDTKLDRQLTNGYTTPRPSSSVTNEASSKTTLTRIIPLERIAYYHLDYTNNPGKFRHSQKIPPTDLYDLHMTNHRRYWWISFQDLHIQQLITRKKTPPAASGHYPAQPDRGIAMKPNHHHPHLGGEHLVCNL